MAWKDFHHVKRVMDKNTINKLAYLSKLSIPESDIEELSNNLENILKLISEIDAAPTDDMDPMAHPLDFSQPLRDDLSIDDINRDENQNDSSKTKDGYYIVPKILD
tara:strand:- start:272 stop:589 length:318 start_codon:yes stop_codon:yes gene_type:complete